MTKDEMIAEANEIKAALANAIGEQLWRIGDPFASSPSAQQVPADAIKIAAQILTYLGFSQDESIHPGADRRRDTVALMIENASLREALAEQPAQQEPVAIVAVDGVGQIQVGWITKPQHNDKLYTSPPAQQEPVEFKCMVIDNHHPNGIPFEQWVKPTQRTWVGLTDEGIWLEYQNFWPFHPAEEPTLAKDIAKFARAIEAKLKEKNT